MIKIELEIDNHTAHSCSPLKFLQRFILFDATEINWKDCNVRTSIAEFSNPFAKIKVTSIEQI